jgi:hypothetical protein
VTILFLAPRGGGYRWRVPRPEEALVAIPLETRRFEDLGALAAIPDETRHFEDLGRYLFEPMTERVRVAEQQASELLGGRKELDRSRENSERLGALRPRQMCAPAACRCHPVRAPHGGHAVPSARLGLHSRRTTEVRAPLRFVLPASALR